MKVSAAADKTVVSDWGSWQQDGGGRPGGAAAGASGAAAAAVPAPPPPIDVSWLKTFMDIANRRGVVIGADTLVREFMSEGISVKQQQHQQKEISDGAGSGDDDEGGVTAGMLQRRGTGIFDAAEAANEGAAQSLRAQRQQEDEDRAASAERARAEVAVSGLPSYMRGTAVSDMKKSETVPTVKPHKPKNSGADAAAAAEGDSGGAARDDAGREDVGALNRPTDGGVDLTAGIVGFGTGRQGGVGGGFSGGTTTAAVTSSRIPGSDIDENSRPIQAPPEALSDIIPAGLISLMQAHSDSHSSRATGVSWTRAVFQAGNGVEIVLPTIDIGATLERIEKTTTDSTLRMLERRNDRQQKLADATSNRLRDAMDYVGTLERKSDAQVDEYLIQRRLCRSSPVKGASSSSSRQQQQQHLAEPEDDYSRQQRLLVEAQAARGDSNPIFRIGSEEQPRSQTSRLPKASRLNKT
jgi:hypothetical protein